jgi:hypothetical protein
MSALPIQTNSPQQFFSHAVAGAIAVPVVALHMKLAHQFIARPIVDSLYHGNEAQLTYLTIAVASAALGVLTCCALAKALGLKERAISYGQMAGLTTLAFHFPPPIQMAAASLVSACMASPLYLRA